MAGSKNIHYQRDHVLKFAHLSPNHVFILDTDAYDTGIGGELLKIWQKRNF